MGYEWRYIFKFADDTYIIMYYHMAGYPVAGSLGAAKGLYIHSMDMDI